MQRGVPEDDVFARHDFHFPRLDHQRRLGHVVRGEGGVLGGVNFIGRVAGQVFAVHKKLKIARAELG